MYISTNKERCVIMGTYLIENNTTIRSVASKFGISKSTVHKDITENLKKINPILYKQVQEVLTKNKIHEKSFITYNYGINDVGC
jgi:putative DeoR family transcriptional regulator (stage III sporulation protein D)